MLGTNQVGQERLQRAAAHLGDERLQLLADYGIAIDGGPKNIDAAAAVAQHIALGLEALEQLVHRRVLGGPALGIEYLGQATHTRWPLVPKELQHRPFRVRGIREHPIHGFLVIDKLYRKEYIDYLYS